MLKLIKYEMIHTYRSFALVYALFIIGCIAVPFLPIDFGLIVSSFIILIVLGIIISVFVTIAKNYSTSMFKKPGYLTLTLPLNTHEIIIAKVISSVIWIFISTIIMVIGLVVSSFGLSAEVGVTFNLSILIENIVQSLKLIGLEWVIKTVLLGVIEAVSGVLGIYALITVLQTKYTRSNKGLAGIVIFVIYAYISFLINVQFPFISEWGLMPVLVIQSVLFYIVTVFVIDKKLEID